jgi:hypothetical protein
MLAPGKLQRAAFRWNALCGSDWSNISPHPRPRAISAAKQMGDRKMRRFFRAGAAFYEP